MGMQRFVLDGDVVKDVLFAVFPVVARNTWCCPRRCQLQCSWARGGLSGDKILSKMAEHGARHSAGFRLDPFSQSHACSTYSAAAASKHMSSTPRLPPSPCAQNTDVLPLNPKSLNPMKSMQQSFSPPLRREIKATKHKF